MNWETGGDRRSLVCVTQVMSEDLLRSTGASISSPWRLKWEGNPTVRTHSWVTLLRGGN